MLYGKMQSGHSLKCLLFHSMKKKSKIKVNVNHDKMFILWVTCSFHFCASIQFRSHSSVKAQTHTENRKEEDFHEMLWQNFKKIITKASSLSEGQQNLHSALSPEIYSKVMEK